MLRAQERKSSLPRCRRGGSRGDALMFPALLASSGQPPSLPAVQPARIGSNGQPILLSAIRDPLSL